MELDRNCEYIIKDYTDTVVFVGKYAGEYPVNSGGVVYEIMNFYNPSGYYDILKSHWKKGIVTLKKIK